MTRFARRNRSRSSGIIIHHKGGYEMASALSVHERSEWPGQRSGEGVVYLRHKPTKSAEITEELSYIVIRHFDWNGALHVAALFFGSCHSIVVDCQNTNSSTLFPRSSSSSGALATFSLAPLSGLKSSEPDPGKECSSEYRDALVYRKPHSRNASFSELQSPLWFLFLHACVQLSWPFLLL